MRWAPSIAAMCKRPEHKPYNADGTPRQHVRKGDKPLSWELIGGPLAGRTLHLWQPRTLAFRLRGEHGYYVLRTGSRRFLQWVRFDPKHLRVIQ